LVHRTLLITRHHERLAGTVLGEVVHDGELYGGCQHKHKAQSHVNVQSRDVGDLGQLGLVLYPQDGQCQHSGRACKLEVRVRSVRNSVQFNLHNYMKNVRSWSPPLREKHCAVRRYPQEPVVRGDGVQEALLAVVEDGVRVPDPIQDVDAQRQVLQGNAHREPLVQPLLPEVAVQRVD
ncbi:hypothetical protein EGW08_002948, partial [Elysia chlorotica]